MKKVVLVALVTIVLYGFNQPKLWYCNARKDSKNYNLVVRATSYEDAELLLFRWLNTNQFEQMKTTVVPDKSVTVAKFYSIVPVEDLIWNEK